MPARAQAFHFEQVVFPVLHQLLRQNAPRCAPLSLHCVRLFVRSLAAERIPAASQ
jgi:hypothetical protein